MPTLQLYLTPIHLRNFAHLNKSKYELARGFGSFFWHYNENKSKEIINKPVENYYCEVRWCGDINEPVASVKKLEEIHSVSIKSQLICENSKNVFLAFATDLMGMLNLDVK